MKRTGLAVRFYDVGGLCAPAGTHCRKLDRMSGRFLCSATATTCAHIRPVNGHATGATTALCEEHAVAARQLDATTQVIERLHTL